MPAQQAKHWCFTINNYTSEEKDELAALVPEHAVYLVYGEEVGENGTPHLQGYISFSVRCVASAVKRLVGRRAHIEIARGTPAQAANYCKKDGAFSEFGTLPVGRGSRSDLQQVQQAIKTGATKAEIRDQFFGTYCRYERAINNYINDLQEGRNWITEVIVYWGKTGTGKTKQVYQFTNSRDIYSHPGEQWFDGYQQHAVVLFDDYNGSEFKLTYFLKLLDRYPMQVPIKGGYVQWVPRKIFITSNKHPDMWYANAFEEHRNALKRRITTITEIK